MKEGLVYYESVHFQHFRILFGTYLVWVLLMDLDRKDFVLLDALQQNASQRLEDLAALVKLAPSSVHERLRRLEREGIIRRWTVDIDTAALGLGVIAFIGIRATRPCSELLVSMRKIPSIEECHSVAGELSMILKVRVRDTAALLSLSEHLRLIPGIEQTETTIVLKTQIDRPIALQPPPTGHTR
jgi:Lrp/AsnC family transcriptional regulator, leucine-responsive regulatory protein